MELFVKRRQSCTAHEHFKRWKHRFNQVLNFEYLPHALAFVFIEVCSAPLFLLNVGSRRAINWWCDDIKSTIIDINMIWWYNNNNMTTTITTVDEVITRCMCLCWKPTSCADVQWWATSWLSRATPSIYQRTASSTSSTAADVFGGSRQGVSPAQRPTSSHRRRRRQGDAGRRRRARRLACRRPVAASAGPPETRERRATWRTPPRLHTAVTSSWRHRRRTQQRRHLSSQSRSTAWLRHCPCRTTAGGVRLRRRMSSAAAACWNSRRPRRTNSHCWRPLKQLQ